MSAPGLLLSKEEGRRAIKLSYSFGFFLLNFVRNGFEKRIKIKTRINTGLLD